MDSRAGSGSRGRPRREPDLAALRAGSGEWIFVATSEAVAWAGAGEERRVRSVAEWAADEPLILRKRREKLDPKPNIRNIIGRWGEPLF